MKKVLNRWIRTTRSRLLFAGSVLALVAVGLAAVLLIQPWSSEDDAASRYTANNLESGAVKGFLHRPVDQPAAPFTLTDQNGQTVSLRDFRGKWVVADWIYTSCVDTCPQLTANMKLLQQGLGDRVGREVQLVTITFDPEHDTVEAMKAYSQNVKGDIPGWSWLTGSKEQTDAVAESYGVAFAQLEPAEHGDGHSHGGVAFDHTTLTVVIDPEGQERHRYFGVGWSDDLLKRLEEKLASSGTGSQASLQGSGGDGHSPGLPTGVPDLQALKAKATEFTWEKWELPSGVSSQVMYQFPTNEQAVTYSQGLMQQTADAGWEKVDNFELLARWTVLRKGKSWAAVGGKENINLVFEMEGNDDQAVY
ncbi:MAG: SCO family protein, partial [Dehalococcoidia bacterium]